MRIAIPTNDKETIFKRSGQAKGFLIADVTDNGFVEVDYRKNSHSHDHGSHHGEHEHHGHSHKEITEALSDCDYMVVNMVGKHFGGDLRDAGIKIFKTDRQLINEAVQEFKKI
jgi:predicted Fe-Mo cluster-binding NifX family protein